MHYLYRITNTLNYKVYIGQTINEKRRWQAHSSYAKQNEPIQYIHRAMKKYGVENFIYEVIAQCLTQEDADETEILLIQQYNSQNKEHGYNVAPGGDHAWNGGLPKEQQPMYGKKQSDYFKQRMSEIHSGKTVIHSEEWKKYMSNILSGIPRADDVKEKISKSNKGLKRSDETKMKISQVQIGKIKSQETKNKMSKSHIGKKKSLKTKKRMSLAKRKFSLQQELQIVELRNSGMKLKKLTVMFGCSEPTIISIMKRHK